MIKLNMQYFAETEAKPTEAENTAETTLAAQTELSTTIEKGKGATEKAVLNLLGLSNKEDASKAVEKFNAWRQAQETEDGKLKILQGDLDDYKIKYEKTLSELTQFKNEKLLISKGVPKDKADYYAFKIGQKVNEDTSFEQATEAYLKENPVVETVKVDFGAPHGSSSPKVGTEPANAAIRAAFGRAI